jgi:hypothetical protein
VPVYHVKRPTKKVFLHLYQDDTLMDSQLWNGINELTLRAGDVEIILPRSTNLPYYEDMAVYRHPLDHHWRYRTSYNRAGQFNTGKLGWWQIDQTTPTKDLNYDLAYDKTAFREKMGSTLLSCLGDHPILHPKATAILSWSGFRMFDPPRVLKLDDLIEGAMVHDFDTSLHNDMSINGIFDSFTHIDQISEIEYQRLLRQTPVSAVDFVGCSGWSRNNVTCAIMFSAQHSIYMLQDHEGQIDGDQIFWLHDCGGNRIACKIDYDVTSGTMACGPDWDWIDMTEIIVSCMGDSEEGTSTCLEFRIADHQPPVTPMSFSTGQTQIHLLQAARVNRAHMIVPSDGSEMMDILIGGHLTYLGFDVANVLPNMRRCRFAVKSRAFTFEAKSDGDAGYALLISEDGTALGNSVMLSDEWRNYTFKVRDSTLSQDSDITLAADGNQVGCSIFIPGIPTNYTKPTVVVITEAVDDIVLDIGDGFTRLWDKLWDIVDWPWWTHLLVWGIVGILGIIVLLGGSILIGVLANYLTLGGWLGTLIKTILLPFKLLFLGLKGLTKILFGLLTGLVKWTQKELKVKKAVSKKKDDNPKPEKPAQEASDIQDIELQDVAGTPIKRVVRY